MARWLPTRDVYFVLSKNAFIYTDLFASIVTYSALTALDGEYRDVTGSVDMLRGFGGLFINSYLW